MDLYFTSGTETQSNMVTDEASHSIGNWTSLNSDTWAIKSRSKGFVDVLTNGDNETITDLRDLVVISHSAPTSTEISSSYGNETTMELPIDMQFSDANLLSVILYSVILVASAFGNLYVLNNMIQIRMKARLTRFNFLILHLTIADLFVTFLMVPLEISWNITISWRAGDFMCRLMSFFRTFGLYLSGFIVICISFDRYFAVLKPLALPEANKRGRLMLYIAWGGSILCSLPQSYVFHLESHPNFKWYKQCITLNSFPSKASELAYNFFGFTFMYGIPMVVIIFCYVSILYEIFKVNARRRNGEELRRSSMEALTRAKVRTLKMTVVIVATFFLCWTPYNVMSLWYWFDEESAKGVDIRIQKGLFLFACTNSAVNPLIYGVFNIRSHKRRNSEVIRQSNNYRLERLDRPPYGVRVRWQPRDCLCTASSSSSESSKLQPRQTRTTTRTQGHHNRRGTRTTMENTYDRRSRTTTLIPLTYKETLNRHVPIPNTSTSPTNAHKFANGCGGSSVVTALVNGVGTTTFIRPFARSPIETEGGLRLHRKTSSETVNGTGVNWNGKKSSGRSDISSSIHSDGREEHNI